MISRVTKLSGSKLILYPKFQHKTKKRPFLWQSKNSGWQLITEAEAAIKSLGW